MGDLVRSSVPHNQFTGGRQDLVHHGHVMRVELALDAIRASEGHDGVWRLGLLLAGGRSTTDGVVRRVTPIRLLGGMGDHARPY